MIICSTYDNLDLTGRAFSAQFRLRHKCFIERQTYNVHCYDGKEYDQYDTPAAVYLVYLSNSGQALGASRLTPTVHQCMLSDLWPEMVNTPCGIGSPQVWEGTRFCIDKDVSPALRKRISNELVLAYLEFGMKADIESIVGLMPRYILRTVFKAAGVDFSCIGPPKTIDGVSVQAASMAVNAAQLLAVREIANIYYPVLGSTKTAAQRRLA